MSNRIEIVNGDEGWRLASRLLEAVWPPEVVATLPWKDVVWARADSRVLNIKGHNDVIGHAGYRLAHDLTGDAPPAAVDACRHAADAADFNRPCVKRRIAQIY